MKFSPFQKVKIIPFDCLGRVSRCILDGGPQPIYGVDYYLNNDVKRHEFYEDELEVDLYK